MISHNPDPTAVTGLKTWMWATAGSLDEFVVRAEPAWTGGTAYDTSLPDGQQDTDCSLTFTRSSARQAGGTTLVTASTVWTASWTGTGAGSPQVLPSTPASSSFPLPVAEVQSVVVSG